jgi:hypothetical protein
LIKPRSGGAKFRWKLYGAVADRDDLAHEFVTDDVGGLHAQA